MEVSKLDAARSQLDAAIELFFLEGHEVAVHTLAAASYEIVAALRKREGHPDDFLDLIVPEHRAEFRRMWNKPQNFFKHADRDPDSKLEFTPAQTHIQLFMASLRFGSFAQRTDRMILFQVWFAIQHPDLLLDSEPKEAASRLSPSFRALSPREFWAQTAPMVPSVMATVTRKDGRRS